MECDICGKRFISSKLTPCHCVTCARAALELPRLELASTLLDRTATGKVVKAVAEASQEKETQYVSLADSKGGLLVDRAECTKSVELGRIRSDTAESEERIRLALEQSNVLRDMIEQARKELEEKRAQVAQRKSDLSSATYGIETRRKNEADKVQHGIKRLDYKGDRTHRDIVEMRASLCKSVARLSGLRMSRKRKKDGTAEDIYVIGPAGGVQIFDLKGLQDAPPDALSASLGLVAQLLVRVASYLGVRLPAEITLPHADYPQATIFQPASSYLGRKVPFPSARHSSTSSPEGSRTLDTQPNLPKPRLLYIDRPLHHLSAQDAPAYSLFIEAVSLLAYDVAWLCRSQGLKEQFDTWEEVSPMGRHLYRLLITQESNTPVRLENPLDKDTSPSGGPKGAETRDSARLGEISHATAHSFLGVAANAQYMGGLTLNPTKLTDDFKAFLLSEQQAQEWDVLSDKEWEDMEKLVAGNPLEAGMSVSDVETGKRPTKTGDGTSPAGDDESSTSTRKKGTSGWTKIKSRAEE